MKIHEIILSESDYEMFLIEKQDYSMLFPPTLLSLHPKADQIVNNAISWSQTLVKNHRIVWYLRLFRLTLVKDMVKTISDPSKKAEAEKYLTKYVNDYNKKSKGTKLNPDLSNLSTLNIRNELQHFMSMSTRIRQIAQYPFTWQLPDELINNLTNIEEEHRDDSSKSRHILHNEHIEIFLKVDDQFTWFNLETGYCDKEAEAMGHCGDADNDDMLLSLRKRIKKTQDGELWKPVLTFSMTSDGHLRQMKGYANSKPQERYHKYILALLKDPRIKGIVSGGYKPENNFHVNDLGEKGKDELFATHPHLKTLIDTVKEHKKEIEQNGLSKDIQKKLSESFYQIKFYKGQIQYDYFKDVETMIENRGDDNAKYILKVLAGEERNEGHFPQSADEFYYLNSDEHKILDDYAERKYPNTYEDTYEDWFETLEQEEPDILYEIKNISLQAHESGIQTELYNRLKNAIEDHNVFDITFEVDKFWDTPVKMLLKNEHVIRFIENSDLDEEPSADDVIDEMFEDEVDIKVDLDNIYEFDEKHFHEELTLILNNMKTEL